MDPHILLYTHMQIQVYIYIIHIHAYTYTCRIHTDAIIKTSEDFFRKIYLSLYLKGCVWEGVGDQTKLQYIDPHSYGHLYRILSFTHLISNSQSGVRRAPSAGWWLSLPHPVSNSSLSNSLNSCLHRVI